MESYHCLTACDNTRHIDDMLARFSSDKRKILTLLINDISKLPTQMWNILCKDSSCLTNMKSASHGYKGYKCCGCKHMSRLVDLETYKMK